MARRNSFLDFARAFGAGYDMVSGVGKDLALARVANQKETATYTPEQAHQLEAIANAKDEQGNPYYNLAANEDGSYSVTPNFKADGQEQAPAKISAQGVNFLGKSYDAPLTDTQRQGARAQAMAGVMEQLGDADGAMRYRQQAQAAEMGQLQISNAKRQAAREDRADRLTAQQDEIDADVASWAQQRLKQPDGTMRDMTPDDHLAAGQYRVAKLVGAGRIADANQLAQANMALAGQKIQLETAERNDALGRLAMQIGAGDLSGVNDFYAKYVPDGAHLDELKVDPKTGVITANRTSLDGRRLAPQTFKNRDELLAGLNALKDPMSLYNFSQNEFTRQLHERQVKVAEANSASLNEDRKAARDQQTAREEAAVSLFKEQNPTATQAQLDAVRAGVIPAVPTEKDSPAEVKLANAIFKSGMAGDMKEALQIAISKKGMSADEMHREFVAAQLKNYASPDDAVKKADEVMDKMGFKKKGNRWDSGSNAPAQPAKPSSAEEAQAQAKQALAAGASKDAVNQRLKAWGFKPLP